MTTVPYTFGNEESPIPLSQLDANFAVTPQFANTAGNVVGNAQANITSVGTLTALSVTGNINSGNLRTSGSLSVSGNVTSGTITSSNVITGGVVSALGTVTGANVIANQLISATGNISAGNNIVASNNIVATNNISAGGTVSTTGNILAQGQVSAAGNIVSQSIISATGNIITAANFIGNFLGNISGNIVGAPGSNTQVAFNTGGNLDAVGGFTYNKDSNVLTVLGVISTTGNISTGANFTAAGNLTANGNMVVTGTTQLVGIVTAPTAPNATSNNQVATTVFVNNQIDQNAQAVNITGGNIDVTDVTSTTFNTANWTVQQYDGNLFFQYNGANKAKLDSAGNFTTTGNITGFGTL
jgi:hypothetical protein